MPPETLLTLGEHLGGRGWSNADIQAVLGGNFFRVAQQTWRANGDPPAASGDYGFTHGGQTTGA